MSKCLDLIKRQQPEIIDGFPTGNMFIGVTKEELVELEKELKDYETFKTGLILGNMSIVDNKIPKAFEVIKKKRVNVDNFLNYIKKDTDYKEYKRLCSLYKIMVFSEELLTEEEYDLLKEVLL